MISTWSRWSALSLLLLLGLLPAAAGPTVRASPESSAPVRSKTPTVIEPGHVPARLPAHTRSPGDRRVPILMYHALSDPPAGAPFPELYVRPTDFAAQMRWLDRQGYRAVTLRHVWDHWQDGVPLPARPIVVSIDDGFRSTALVALPELRRRGWPGVLNLALHHLDVRGGISSRQVRDLIDAGWEIDAHTLTHPDLTTISDSRLVREVAGSRREIQRRFGVPVDFFCYPAGRYDERVVAAVRRAGFLGATTTLEGLADRNVPFTLRRVRVSRSDGLEGFAASLTRIRVG